jgi:hypothetical protein
MRRWLWFGAGVVVGITAGLVFWIRSEGDSR